MDTLTPKKIPPKLIVGAIITIVAVLVFFVLMPRDKKKVAIPQSKSTLNESDNVAPTVDPSVTVALNLEKGSKDVSLKIGSIPSGTRSIEYMLSYQEKTKGLQGVIGTITLTKGEKEYAKQITLGTCSSGKCVYHEVIGKVNVGLKFSGTYGDRSFEKDYDI